MPTLTKKSNGKWMCQIQINGTRYSAVGKTKQDAIINANLKANETAEIRHKMPTLSEACESYIDLKETQLSPTTITAYRSIAKTNFRECMPKPIDEITITDLQKEVIRLNNNGKSPKTIQNNIRFIATVLKYNDIIIDTNKIVAPKKKKTVYTTPSSNEAKQIINAVTGTELEVPTLLAMWLGLRASEIAGLKWNKITPTSITIDNVRVYTSGRTYDKPPKTDNGTRQIPIPKYLYNKIVKLDRTSEYLIPYNPNRIGKKFELALKRANLPHVRFHDLRHFNASVMKLLNVPDIYAMERCGWSDKKMYDNIYSQVFSAQQIEIANLIDNYMQSVIGQSDNR